MIESECALNPPTAAPFWSAARYADFGLQASPRRVANPGGPRDVAAILDHRVANAPCAEALVDRRGRVTYAGLDAAVNAAAAVLREAGVGYGDRVAASGANHNDLVVAFLATQRLGAIWVGINRAYAPPEKRYLIDDSQACVLLCDAATAAIARDWTRDLPLLRRVMVLDPGDARCEFTPSLARHQGAARPEIDIDPWAPAAIAYTSGTTGFPKGVVHSQHNMMVTAAVSVDYSGDDVPETVRGTALPMTILNVMILGPVAALATGAVHVSLDRIDAAGIAAWIAAERIANMSLVPTIVQDLLTNPDIDPAHLASLSWLVVGGSTVPRDLPEIYQRHFGRRMTIGYGLTEGPNGVAKTHAASPDAAGVIGRALPHLEMAILDDAGAPMPDDAVGEIVLRATRSGRWANVYTPALGYWRQAEATRTLLRGGWVHTGDFGVRDAAGEFYIRDRRSDLILRGGSNIYPAEIERVLRLDPRVRDCAVLGRSDARLGQIVVAYVEASEPLASHPQLIADLRALCAGNLAAYKCPAVWHVIDAMPRNAMGKITKGQLAAMAGADAVAEDTGAP